jgi:hypothetical protein
MSFVVMCVTARSFITFTRRFLKTSLGPARAHEVTGRVCDLAVLRTQETGPSQLDAKLQANVAECN